MIRFIDGPAKGVAFRNLQRRPILLRIVFDENGKWDVLDLLEDKAKESEKIFLYWIIGEASSAFLDGYDRQAGRRIGWREDFGDYQLFPESLADETLRDNVKWDEWCKANTGRILAMRKAANNGNR